MKVFITLSLILVASASRNVGAAETMTLDLDSMTKQMMKAAGDPLISASEAATEEEVEKCFDFTGRWVGSCTLSDGTSQRLRLNLRQFNCREFYEDAGRDFRVIGSVGSSTTGSEPKLSTYFKSHTHSLNWTSDRTSLTGYGESLTKMVTGVPYFIRFRYLTKYKGVSASQINYDADVTMTHIIDWTEKIVGHQTLHCTLHKR